MKNQVTSRRAVRGIELKLPASSANLGPAFDSAALAIDLYLRVRAHAAATFSITVRGRDAEQCSTLEHNLIIGAYREVLDRCGASCMPLAISMHNEIPVGRGCGSSAAARLAGVSLAVHFADLGWGADQILDEAIRQEGHADNVAACWLGGFVIVQGNRNVYGPRKQAVRIDVAQHHPLLLVLAANGLATAKSRALVPALYGRESVVSNLQSAMALVAALALGRDDLFTTAQNDSLHQPFRADACPLLPCLQPLAGKAGILAVTLSGAGSSVLMILRDDASRSEVCQLVSERLRLMNLEGELVFTRIAQEGVQSRELAADALVQERV